MGWGRATKIFDRVADVLFSENKLDQKKVLKELAEELEGEDWDCQSDSQYWDHPVVREIMMELHPEWDW